MKTMKFADNLEKKIDMKKIQLELMKPFITSKLNAMMPIEDDVIIEYVYSQLEESQVYYFFKPIDLSRRDLLIVQARSKLPLDLNKR